MPDFPIEPKVYQVGFDFDNSGIALSFHVPAPKKGRNQEPDLQEKQALELRRNMQRNRSKRYRAAAEQVDRTKTYNLPDAVSTLKKLPPTKFDQTVTMAFRLGVDPKQSDQMVRGTCPLPHGSGKTVRVLVFAEGQAAKAAKEAGAEFVGF